MSEKYSIESLRGTLLSQEKEKKGGKKKKKRRRKLASTSQDQAQVFLYKEDLPLA